MAWVTGAPGELGPGVVVTALGLLVAHVAAALAAAMPVTAGADRRIVLRWAGPTAWIAAAVLAAAAIVAALQAWSPAGSIVVTLSALALVTAAAWWWSVATGADRRTRRRRTARPTREPARFRGGCGWPRGRGTAA